MDGVVPETDSVTVLFRRVRCGDQGAAIALWPWIQRVACGSYNGLAERLELDEAVNDAYAKILQLAPLGRVDGIGNREELRRLLRRMVYCKLLNQLRRVRPNPDRPNRAWEIDLDDAADAGPRPERFVAIRDELGRISEELRRRHPHYAEIFRLRLDGHGVAEIAEALGRHPRTIKRKLEVIEAFVRQMLGGDAGRGTTRRTIEDDS